jgi:CheY-like chemotaxis protein
VLVIHDDGDALDVMTRLFEGSGFDVITAVAGFRAQAHLEGTRPIDVVVAPWETAHGVGGEVYRWSLEHRYDLRDQFVFVGSEVPSEFDQIVAGRCLVIPMDRPTELVHVALAAAKRRAQLESTSDVAADPDPVRPRLLLADDEPVLLAAMSDYLDQVGYAVTRVDTGHAAIIKLIEDDEFDVILADWQMPDGSGADVYHWIRQHRPDLSERVVFLSGAESDEVGDIAPGRPMVPKGQDAHVLTSVLDGIVRQARGEPDPAGPQE